MAEVLHQLLHGFLQLTVLAVRSSDDLTLSAQLHLRGPGHSPPPPPSHIFCMHLCIGFHLQGKLLPRTLKTNKQTYLSIKIPQTHFPYQNLVGQQGVTNHEEPCGLTRCLSLPHNALHSLPVFMTGDPFIFRRVIHSYLGG